MALVPTNDIQLDLEDIEEETEPSLTWKIDFETGRITGMIDKLEAVKQAVHVILQTERYEHLIYSFDFGTELKGLFGMSPIFVESDLERRISEALEQDDRIQGIENFQAEIKGDSIVARFTVITDYGSFDYEQEVASSV